MTFTGWMHFGVLLLLFVGIAAFALRKMVLPTPKEPPRGETVGGATYGGSGGFIGGGHSGSGH
ncbi:hypothetical protein [Mesorhizobium sp. J8]|uniref:hypothetical protein n=1 Tax=Mesorhizobium sp. J8 TaxID=2777475 RepID=UPI001915E06F|nr:hypothetical protein [Mesorhizobium sp. J8]BCM21763.1 hypothetical protein MJ8_55600 [Mesorhizobium sp. J8]